MSLTANKKRDGIEGTVDVTLLLHDWVWLCETLAAIRNQPDVEQMTKHDYDRVMSCLATLENCV